MTEMMVSKAKKKHCSNHPERAARTHGLCAKCYQREWRKQKQPSRVQLLEIENQTLRRQLESYGALLDQLEIAKGWLEQLVGNSRQEVAPVVRLQRRRIDTLQRVDEGLSA